MFYPKRLLNSVYSTTQQCLLLRLITGLAAQPRSLPESSKMMQAWQINAYGDVKQLQLQESPIPPISGTTELLIKVKATSLNPIDLNVLGGYGRSLFGLLRWYKNEFPLVLGREFAGTVVNKGRCVSDDEFKVGDEVYGIIPIQKQGTLRQYLLADKSQILLRPTYLSVDEAASLLYTSITAWSALFLTGGLAGVADLSKTRVLVLGASGGVGTVATQMLKAHNVTVVGVCATDAVPLVTSLGADFVHDYKDPKYIAQVAAHGVYDVILDCAKYDYDKISKDWKYKTFVTLNSPLPTNADNYGLIGGLTLSATQLLTANVPRIFSRQSVRWGFFSPQPSAFNFIDKLVKSQQLKPIIQKVFKFNEVPEAFNKLQAGHLRGKLVIDLQ